MAEMKTPCEYLLAAFLWSQIAYIFYFLWNRVLLNTTQCSLKSKHPVNKLKRNEGNTQKVFVISFWLQAQRQQIKNKEVHLCELTAPHTTTAIVFSSLVS